MQSVQILHTEENGREQITIRIWRETHEKLHAIKKETGTPIVKLIDRGLKLLEKQENDNR